VSKGREVPIHQLLRLCPVLDRKHLAQDGDIGTILLGSAQHELAGQEVVEVPRGVEMQLAMGFEQPLGWKLLFAQFQ